MTINLHSLHAKLLNIAKEKKVDFQIMLNRFGAEQFLARLSFSEYVDQFIFKGGSLLSYLIETDRKTKDLDFSIRQFEFQIEKASQAVKSILEIPYEDGINWDKVDEYPLKHPDMEHAGRRMIVHFLIGKMKGRVQMDLAFGDIEEAVKVPMERIRYKGKPLLGTDFDLLTYPAETIFAEKFQIATIKANKNTRMKDYYDLFKLSNDHLNPELLKKSMISTFKKRKIEMNQSLNFDQETIDRLQLYWGAYIIKAKLHDAPKNILDVMKMVNEKLEQVFSK